MPNTENNSMHYPDFAREFPLRLHILERGSLLRSRAAALAEYAGATQRQMLESGEILLSAAMPRHNGFLYERLVETLGEGGLTLPWRRTGGFDTWSKTLTGPAACMARDNNLARSYSWRFERLAASLPTMRVPPDKPRVPDDLPWDPDPIFQRILDLTSRHDLHGALDAVEAIQPEDREVLFDEVFYLKSCNGARLRAQDLRYIARKYVRRSPIRESLDRNFDLFLGFLDPLIPGWRRIRDAGYPWNTLIPWPRFKRRVYRHMRRFGHPSWPRGRIFVWHPDIYHLHASGIDRLFRPMLVAAENAFRRDVGVPVIGGRWQSEGRLFELVQARFQDAIRSWSPRWLGNQRVDIYVPSLNLAIEYHGEQHYKAIYFFGGEAGFLDTLRRDKRKRELLNHRGVRLIEWRFDRPITDQQLDLEIHEAERTIRPSGRRRFLT